MSKARRFIRDNTFARWGLALLAAILISLGTGWSYASVVALNAEKAIAAVKEQMASTSCQNDARMQRIENKLDRLLERTAK